MVLRSGPVDVYKMVLNGTLKQFPNGFWSVPENYDYAVKCMRYLIEHVLKWDEEQVKKNYSKEMLQKYKLRGMVQVLFPHSIYDALDNAYRGKYKPWELNKVGFVWDEDKIIEATKWLVEEKLKLDIYNLENELYITHFEDNGMASVVQGKIKYNAIYVLYPYATCIIPPSPFSVKVLATSFSQTSSLLHFNLSSINHLVAFIALFLLLQ